MLRKIYSIRGVWGPLAALIGLWLIYPLHLFEEVPHSLWVQDHQGNTLAVSLAQDGQWRFPKGAAVSDKYFHALLAFEDRHFYKHPGVNPASLLRAGKSLFTGGKRLGGSTLTMQLARRSLGMKRRTVWAKSLELLQAFKIELWLSKAEILHHYAAEAPFGGNVVGVEAACQRFFGHTAEVLSWGEAALLAILPNKPSSLIPGRNNPMLLARRNNLLLRLWKEGKLSEQEYELAISEPLPERWRAIQVISPHLLSTLRKHNPQGGIMKTDIQVGLQLKIQALVNQYCQQLTPNGVTHASALVYDLQQQKLLAYVGNRTDRKADVSDGDDFDMIHQPRSYGSLLKPLLMAYALELGKASPSRLLPDYDMNFQGYSPQNFDRKYQGAIRMNEALARSQNIPFVYLLKEVGTASFLNFLRRSGLTSLRKSPSHYGLSLILGGAELSLWELAQTYAGFASVMAPGVPLEKTTASWSFNFQPTLVKLSPWSVYHTINAMKEAERPGLDNNWRLYAKERPFAWKTGTSFGYRDAWAIGFDARFLVAVWAGNARNRSCAGLTGISTAAPLMFDIRAGLTPAPLPAVPNVKFKRQPLCAQSGLAPSPDCPRSEWISGSNTSLYPVCNWHKTIMISPDGRYRLNDRCANFRDATAVVWWVLPPTMSYYYRLMHPDYQPLPPFSPDCPGNTKEYPLQIIYPDDHGKLITEDGVQKGNGAIVAKAIHTIPEAHVYWFLNGKFIQATQGTHQILITPVHGSNQLSIHDDHGNSSQIHFDKM